MNNVKDLVSDIENDKLRETLRDMDEKNMDDLSQMMSLFPEEEARLQGIEALADSDSSVKERLLDENGKPDPAAVFGYFDKEHRFIHYVAESGKRTHRILAYKNGMYHFGGGGFLKYKFQNLMPSSSSKYYKDQVIDNALDHRLGKRGKTSELYDNMVNLDPPQRKLNFENGVFDMDSEELLEHSPEFYFTTKLPYNYNPEAEAEKWFEFLKEVLPNYEVQEKKLQEFFGYCLKHWSVDFEKAALLLGPTNSGKGVILSVLKAVIGERNVSKLPLKELVDSNFGNQHILGKMVNINNDLSHSAIQNNDNAKKVISGEEVVINEKNRKKFIAEPNAKHFYSANFPPRDTINDDAYYGRWITFRIPKSIPESEQDRRLRDKLKMERQGICNWAIEGLKRLEEQGHFTGSMSIDETKDLWRRYGDPVARFYHHALEYEQGQQVSIDQLYDLLEEYCNAMDEEVPSKKKLTEYILKQKPAIEKTKFYTSEGTDKYQQRGLRNVKLVDQARVKLLAEAE